MTQPIPCPGSGRRTQSGMGRRICPICHKTISKVGAKPAKIVPVHTHSAKETH